MNRSLCAFVFFVAVVSAQQCVFNREETFTSKSLTIQTLSVDHDFGTSRDIEFVQGDILAVTVTASVEDPTLLLPSHFTLTFNEQDNTTHVAIVMLLIYTY
jgi:hypothetical protein